VRALSVVDSFVDLKTGVGLSALARTPFIVPMQYTEQELSDLVDFNWLARRVVRALPEASLQDSLEFTDSAAADQWAKINALEGNDDGAFLHACNLARTHGVSLLILGQKWSGSPETPMTDFGEPVQWLDPVRSEEFTVSAGDICKDPNNEARFNRPEYFRICGTHRFAGQRIHHSRVVVFSGPAYSDPMHSRNWQKLQGLSAIDPCADVLAKYGLTWSAVSTLFQQASIPIMTQAGVIAGLAQNSKEVKARLQLQQEMLSVNRVVILDADRNEKYQRESVSFADMPNMLQQVSLQMAAATELPVSELFGRIVSGLGDTGEVEERRWNKRCTSYRTNSLDPRIARIMGTEAKYSWKPLKIQTPTEAAQGVRGFWDMGTVTDAEARRAAENALGLEPLTPAQALALAERSNGLSEI
jgi:phage-related protein (TIGR01555 family)